MRKVEERITLPKIIKVIRVTSNKNVNLQCIF